MNKELAAIGDGLIGVCELVTKFKEGVSELCKNELTTLNELRHKKTKQAFEGREILFDLIATTHCAYTFTEQVSRLLWLCSRSERLTAIQSQVRTAHQWNLLDDFLYQMKRELTESECKFEEFITQHNEVQSRLLTAALLTDELKLEACKAKVLTQAVGATTSVGLAGVATGGAIATVTGVGVSLSIASGFFTFGLGVPIGLAITGATAAATGTAAAIATGGTTAYIAHKYSKTIRNYRQLFVTLRNIDFISKSIKEHITNMKQYTQRINTTVDGVHHYHSNRPMVEPICEGLDYLQFITTQIYPQYSSQCREIETCAGKLRDKINEIYAL